MSSRAGASQGVAGPAGIPPTVPAGEGPLPTGGTPRCARPSYVPESMSTEEYQRIAEAGRRHAIESARAQGLPDVITDPDVLRQVAILMGAARRVR